MATAMAPRRRRTRVANLGRYKLAQIVARTLVARGRSCLAENPPLGRLGGLEVAMLPPKAQLLMLQSLHLHVLLGSPALLEWKQQDSSQTQKVTNPERSSVGYEVRLLLLRAIKCIAYLVILTSGLRRA